MAYFITDDNTSKGKDPNINIISSIHKIKGKHLSTYLFLIIAINPSLSIRESVLGHLEPAVMDDTTIDQRETHQANSVTLKEMMVETVTLIPSTHLTMNYPKLTNMNLMPYYRNMNPNSQRMKPSIGTTPLTSMTIDTGTSDPVSQKPYPIDIKHYQCVKEEIEKLLAAKVIHSSRSSWSVPIIVVPKGDGGKCLVIDYRALNKVTRKFTWAMPKVEDIFSTLNGATYFTTLDL